ncbi:hypothetical protein [Stenotrophomonas rhizophila]|uniref:hypothetical protein n=1 Tax=Stenotrophomonas rhizophila TaxID=216778 RepID=UPI001E3CA350|nr:hypothetical protein [Stenotrophomonas rhizophila]MCC7633141.1 hypothetical protein [Stenotrophomonas rhizophila]MCC7662034.1 hypothetical protein [Stenotrophomonas rhizophila]
MKRVTLLFACIALSGTAAAADRIAGPLILEETQESPLGLYGVALPLANGQVPMLENPQAPSAVPHLWTDLDALLTQDALDTVVFPGEGHSGAITRLDAPGHCLYSLGSAGPAGAKVLWFDLGEGSPACTTWQNQGEGRIADLSATSTSWLTYVRYGSSPGYLVVVPQAPSVGVRTDLMVDLTP